MNENAPTCCGHLIYTNFNGVVITNQYDLMNRASAGGPLAAFTYTLDGQRQTMIDPSGAYSYTYDVRDRVCTNFTPQGILYYQYDANGNLTNLSSSTSGGTQVGYQFDALNRLTNVFDGRLSGTSNTALGYDLVGNLQRMQYPNGVTNVYQYDSLNRLTSLVWKTNGTTIASFAYQLGPTGNRTNLQEVMPGSISRTNRWSYDPVYKLTLETINTNSTLKSLGYTYDDVGNRLTRSATNFTDVGFMTNQSFTYNTNDWLASDGYDNNGNTTNSAGTNYFYDVENRLTNVTCGSFSVTVVYNGDGHRVAKTVTSGGTPTTTLYLVDTHNLTGYAQVLEELQPNGGSTNLMRAYTYGLSLISQRLIGSSTNFFGTDGHGSVRFLAGTNGTVTDTFTYDAFGTLVNTSGTTPNNYLYCAEQLDWDVGLYFLRARYMSPNTGRFWTMDTFEGNQGDPLSLHMYFYAGDNPIDNVDPSGNDIVSVLAVISIAAIFFAEVSPALAAAQPVESALSDPNTDQGLVERLLLCESRNPYGNLQTYNEQEVLKGMNAMGACILNRIAIKGYPSTIKGVVTQKKQFRGFEQYPSLSQDYTDKLKQILNWASIRNGKQTDYINLINGAKRVAKNTVNSKINDPFAKNLGTYGFRTTDHDEPGGNFTELGQIAGNTFYTIPNPEKKGPPKKKK